MYVRIPLYNSSYIHTYAMYSCFTQFVSSVEQTYVRTYMYECCTVIYYNNTYLRTHVHDFRLFPRAPKIVPSNTSPLVLSTHPSQTTNVFCRLRGAMPLLIWGLNLNLRMLPTMMKWMLRWWGKRWGMLLLYWLITRKQNWGTFKKAACIFKGPQ